MSTFLTFGSSSYTNTVTRIRAQANDCPFTSVVCVDENDLKAMPEFWDKHGVFVERHARGYGYWIWKSYLTWKTLREMTEGDILVYADAGCTLHPLHFTTLFETVDAHDGAASQLDYPEEHHCKMDLAIALQGTSHMHSRGFHATFFALKCTPANIALAKKWYDTMCDYHLIDDSPSVQPNAPSFKEHRHDQSVWSLLRKMYGRHAIISPSTCPIRETRIRTC